jgi:hypothetical protein
LPEFLSFYNDWVLGYTRPASDKRPKDTRHSYFVYDLKRESHYPFGPVYTASYAYIQSATEDYVQIIVLYFNLDDMKVRDENSVMANTKPVGLRVHWHSYVFDNEHGENLKGHGGEIIMPYFDSPAIDGEEYGPGLAMVMVCDSKDSSEDTEPDIMLALVRIPDHSLPQTSISHRRRVRRDGTIGEVIWMRPIATNIIMSIYSQNLIVVKNDRKFDILSGTDGKIVRQFDWSDPCMFWPVIGPYCYLLSHNNDSFIVNIKTGETFRHSNKLRPPKRRRSAASVESPHVTGDVNVSEASSNADTTPEELSPTNQSTRSLVISRCWPFCSCIGRLSVQKSEHRIRFYLYRLYGL